MRFVLTLVLLSSALLLSVPVAADTVATGVDETQEEVSTQEAACQTEETCDAPVAKARVEAGGGSVEADVPEERCISDRVVTEMQDPECQPSQPSVDPGVARLYVTVKDQKVGHGGSSDDVSTEATAGQQAPSEGLSAEAKAAIAAGVLGTAGAAGAAALFGGRRLLTVMLGPLAARLEPDELLEDETRRGLYETIRDDPGINLRGLADELDLAWGTLLHHLHKLEKAHMVTSKRYGKYRRYFLNGTTYNQEEKARLAALSTPSTARVAEYILEHPGATQSEVGEALDVTPSTVLWHARRLKDVDLLETERDGRYVRYYPRLTQNERAQLVSA